MGLSQIILSTIIFVLALWAFPLRAEVNLRQFAGSEININIPSHPHYDIMMDLLPQFTNETGIKVHVDQLQYQSMRAKQALELSKPQGDYDLLAYVVTSRSDFIKMGRLYPLKTFFNNPNLASEYYEPDDLITAYIQNIGVENTLNYPRKEFSDFLYGLPFGAETSILGYRKDILEKYDLSPPTDYNAFLEIVCRLNQQEQGIAGITSRGASGHQIAHAFLLHLAPLGGRVLDQNMKPIINNQKGIEAAETLKKLFKCAPRGVEAFGFSDMKNTFLQGKSVFYLDTTIVAGEVNDPKKSKIIGNVGWSLHPKGIKRASQTGGFGLAIPTNSKNPQAAFLLMQWLTSKRIDKKIALMGGNPSRFSTHQDKDVIKKYPHFKLFGEALKYADPDWRPIIPEWAEIEKKIGTELSKALTGQKTIKQALDNTAFAIEKILAKAGYYEK